MSMMVWSHLAYLLVMVSITFWVGRTLRIQGASLITTGLEDRKPLADSLAHLLVVGYYLLNLGIIAIALRYGERAHALESAMESLCHKVGFVLLGQGLVYFIIVGVVSNTRRRYEDESRDRVWLDRSKPRKLEDFV